MHKYNAVPQKQKPIRARIYYSFINELSKQIHQIDPTRPVALGNGELVGLEYAKDYAPDVDLVACIIYRGKTFGNLFRALKRDFDKPLLISEFGADAYDAYLKKEDQNMQAFFLELLVGLAFIRLVDETAIARIVLVLDDPYLVV